MLKTEAWVLSRQQDATSGPQPGELRLEEVHISALEAMDVLVEPLYGCWEANMAHAIERRPVDVCQQRGEERVVVGNAGVVRVLKCGSGVHNLKEGDVCTFFGTGCYDQYGYMEKAHGYDAPGTVGLLARRTKVPASNLQRIPVDTRFSLPQWAAYSLRYLTAWSNWRVALGCLRTQLSEQDLPAPHVWGWGGGTTFAELDLAKRAGCKVTMISGTPANLDRIKAARIDVLDRREFPDLSVDDQRYKSDAAYRKQCQECEGRFLKTVLDRTDGLGVSIFVDFIGSPVARATLKALGRQGVLTTAGWKLGMVTPLNRAMESIKRHVHVHTHFARLQDVPAAMAFSESNGWMPPPPERVYAWDEIPLLVKDYAAGKADFYFPVFQVNHV